MVTMWVLWHHSDQCLDYWRQGRVGRITRTRSTGCGSNMSRSQKRTLIFLSSLAIVLSMLCLINENWRFYPTVKLEPLVTLVASAIPVLSLWWPFRPKYRSDRIADSLEINLHNQATMEFGEGEYRFIPYFANNSDTSVHLRVCLHPDFVGSAVAGGVNRFTDVKDASQFELSKADKSPNINDIVILKNRFENYALLKVTNIEEYSGNVKGKMVFVDYVINPTGGVNFS